MRFFAFSAFSIGAKTAKGQRDRYARLTDEQKAQRNARRRENYARKKAGMSEQNPSTPVDSGVGTIVPASGVCPI